MMAGMKEDLKLISEMTNLIKSDFKTKLWDTSSEIGIFTSNFVALIDVKSTQVFKKDIVNI